MCGLQRRQKNYSSSQKTRFEVPGALSEGYLMKTPSKRHFFVRWSYTSATGTSSSTQCFEALGKPPSQGSHYPKTARRNSNPCLLIGENNSLDSRQESAMLPQKVKHRFAAGSSNSTSKYIPKVIERMD